MEMDEGGGGSRGGAQQVGAGEASEGHEGKGGVDIGPLLEEIQSALEE